MLGASTAPQGRRSPFPSKADENVMEIQLMSPCHHATPRVYSFKFTEWQSVSMLPDLVFQPEACTCTVPIMDTAGLYLLSTPALSGNRYGTLKRVGILERDRVEETTNPTSYCVASR